MSELKLSLIQTADHYVQEGWTIEVEGELYSVSKVVPMGPPVFTLTYGGKVIPARVILTLEKAESAAVTRPE